jgi:hypothetical protein
MEVAMDWSDPATLAMPHGVAAVIRILDGATVPFSIRELARMASISATNARHAVDRLAEHGLVSTDHAAGARLVRLNRSHLAAGPMVAIANLRGRTLEKLRTEFAGWEPSPVHVSLYGSAARGDGDTGSDIDLLLVRDDSVAGDEWDRQVADTGAAIAAWTGNLVSWFEIDPGQLARMTAKNEPIVSSWSRDAITLFGSAFPLLLRKIK